MSSLEVVGPNLKSCHVNLHVTLVTPRRSKTRNSALLYHILLLKKLTRKKCVSVSGKNQFISVVSARAEKRNHIRETQYGM